MWTKDKNRFYSLASNGRYELFGLNGADHASISTVLLLCISILSFILFNTLWHIRAVLIAWVVLRLVWYLIEHKQELAMCKANKNRPKNVWKFWRWSKDRIQDMAMPLVSDSLFIGLWSYFIYTVIL